MTVYRRIWSPERATIGEDEALAYALAECGLRPGPGGLDSINREMAEAIVEYVFSGNWIKEEVAV